MAHSLRQVLCFQVGRDCHHSSFDSEKRNVAQVARDNQPTAQSLTNSAREGRLAPIVEDNYYSVDDIAALWKLSRDSVRRLFRHEPGVLALAPRNTRGKRSYTTLRIPQSVLERVHRRLSLVR